MTSELPVSSDVARKSSTSIVSRLSISQQTAKTKSLELISLCYGCGEELEVEPMSRTAWAKSVAMLYDPNAGELHQNIPIS
jgi:hypothetical protein